MNIKLIPQYKSLSSGCDYVEKYLKYVRIFSVFTCMSVTVDGVWIGD
jgi:hypothetical protein